MKNQKNKKKQEQNIKIFFGAAVILLVLILGILYFKKKQEIVLVPLTTEEIENQNMEAERINKMIYETQIQLEKMKKEDAVSGGNNKQMLEKDMANLQLVVDNYERLLDLRYSGLEVDTQEDIFSELLAHAKNNDVGRTDESLNSLLATLSSEKSILMVSAAVAAGPSIPASVPAANTPPTSGFRRQKVTAGGRSYLVDIVAADLNSNRVIVDTASDSTCGNNCPVLPLASYVGRNGAFAGINGTYFCPETYPSCANKKNAFDTLVMNKNKVYFNSDNNVYSTVPAAIFSQGNARFVAASRDWGRDTGVDAVIANRPLLTMDGNLMFGGGGEAKEGIRGTRSFVGGSGNMAYIGVVRNATVAEAAVVMQTMGIKGSINLDSGGSTALWSGGYKAGPGRRIPNAILFVRR